MLIHQVLNALNGIEECADSSIVVKCINEVCYIFAHVDLGVPLFVCQFGATVNEV